MGKKGVKVVGMAQGSFSAKAVLKRMRMKKIMPVKFRTSDLYAMGNGMVMNFLDENTLLFGDDGGGGWVAGVEFARPAGNAEHDAVSAGRCVESGRLRHREEAPAGIALYDGFFERSELQPGCDHVGFAHGGDHVVPGEGRYAL